MFVSLCSGASGLSWPLGVHVLRFVFRYIRSTTELILSSLALVEKVLSIHFILRNHVLDDLGYTTPAAVGPSPLLTSGTGSQASKTGT